ADNGGPTLTHALLSGSPAIDAAVAIVGITNDQRGVSRPQGTAPDIGAVESPFSVQTIHFPAIPDQVSTNLLGLTATASSGLPVSFAVGSGPGSLSDGTNLMFTGAGMVSVVASQAGDSNWSVAPSVTNTFTVLGVYTVQVVSAHGMAEPAEGDHIYVQGTVITNQVLSPETLGTTQFVAIGWAMTGHEPASGADAELVFAVTNNATLTWLWTTQYWLQVQSGPNGSVDPGDGWQAAGATVDLTALPDLYYALDQWSGDASGDANPLPLLMSGARSVSASFAALYTTNHPTPLWWMASFGITNDFETAVGEDPDGDGALTWEEFIMDTDPTDPDSVLRVRAIDPFFGTNCWEVVWTNHVPPFEIGTNIECEVISQVITWPVSTQRMYDVSAAAGVAQPWQPLPGMTNLAPTLPFLIITNPTPGSELEVFRIDVNVP
ncbi:MAG TPA: choice-of-anchor Q domain-containing protein, partial [Kiritimatiellia bacterium]|nr:choice-of-anchor Q domain-containing protein [Kiritimatiellia bacterium]